MVQVLLDGVKSRWDSDGCLTLSEVRDLQRLQKSRVDLMELRLLKRMKERADKTDIVLGTGDCEVVEQADSVEIFDDEVAVHAGSKGVSLDKCFEIPLQSDVCRISDDSVAVVGGEGSVSALDMRDFNMKNEEDLESERLVWDSLLDMDDPYWVTDNSFGLPSSQEVAPLCS